MASITGGWDSEESKTKTGMFTSRDYSKGNNVSKRTFKGLRHHNYQEGDIALMLAYVTESSSQSYGSSN